MQNILRFLVKYRVLSIFLILQFLGLSITYSKSTIHQSYFWEKVLNSQARWHYFTSSWTSYFELDDINQALRIENNKLRTELNGQFNKSSNLVDSSQFEWSSGEIIYSSVNLKNNLLILNRGDSEGVMSGDGILGPRGVLGVVEKTSSHYSRIIPIINSESRISGIIKRTGHFGTIVWKGGNPNFAQIIDLPLEIKLNIRDEIITDPRSTVFPSGWPIGYITEIIKDSSNHTQSATIRLFVDYKKTQVAYIVFNNLASELDEIVKP